MLVPEQGTSYIIGYIWGSTIGYPRILCLALWMQTVLKSKGPWTLDLPIDGRAHCKGPWRRQNAWIWGSLPWPFVSKNIWHTAYKTKQLKRNISGIETNDSKYPSFRLFVVFKIKKWLKAIPPFRATKTIKTVDCSCCQGNHVTVTFTSPGNWPAGTEAH